MVKVLYFVTRDTIRSRPTATSFHLCFSIYITLLFLFLCQETLGIKVTTLSNPEINPKSIRKIASIRVNTTTNTSSTTSTTTTTSNPLLSEEIEEDISETTTLHQKDDTDMKNDEEPDAGTYITTTEKIPANGGTGITTAPLKSNEKVKDPKKTRGILFYPHEIQNLQVHATFNNKNTTNKHKKNDTRSPVTSTSTPVRKTGESDKMIEFPWAEYSDLEPIHELNEPEEGPSNNNENEELAVIKPSLLEQYKKFHHVKNNDNANLNRKPKEEIIRSSSRYDIFISSKKNAFTAMKMRKQKKVPLEEFMQEKKSLRQIKKGSKKIWTKEDNKNTDNHPHPQGHQNQITRNGNGTGPLQMKKVSVEDDEHQGFVSNTSTTTTNSLRKISMARQLKHFRKLMEKQIEVGEDPHLFKPIKMKEKEGSTAIPTNSISQTAHANNTRSRIESPVRNVTSSSKRQESNRKAEEIKQDLELDT